MCIYCSELPILETKLKNGDETEIITKESIGNAGTLKELLTTPKSKSWRAMPNASLLTIKPNKMVAKPKAQNHKSLKKKY